MSDKKKGGSIFWLLPWFVLAIYLYSIAGKK